MEKGGNESLMTDQTDQTALPLGWVCLDWTCPVRLRFSQSIPLLTPLIDPNWINSELAIALVKFF